MPSPLPEKAFSRTVPSSPRQYVDEKPRGSALDRQSAETENHGDKETAGDPNAMGPSMRMPYVAAAPRFDDSAQEPDGMGQIHGRQNDGYPYADGDILGSVEDLSSPYPGYPEDSVPGLSPRFRGRANIESDRLFPDFPDDRKGRSRDVE